MSGRTLALALLVFGAVWAGPATALADGGDSVSFRKGLSLREAGRWSEAADAFWGVIEIDPNVYMAHVYYQDVSRKQGVSPDDLKSDYDSFIEDAPDDGAFVLHRLRLEGPDARLKGLLKLKKARPKPSPEMAARISFELGLLRLEQGDASGALKVLSLAVKAGNPYAVALLARAQAVSGKAKSVEKTLAKGGEHPAVLLEAAGFALSDGRPAVALERADAVLQGRADSLRALLIRSEAFERLGKRAEALETLTAARRHTKDATPVLLALADLLGRDGTPEALKLAAGIYEPLLVKEPGNARGLYGLAWVREREEKFEDAEALYKKALVAQPGDVPTVESIGYVLFKRGRVTEAQVQFRKAIDLDPTYASAYANLGATHDAKAEYAKAIGWYEKLLALRGQKNNIRGLVNSAFDYEQLGAFPKAEDRLRQAIKIRDDDPDLHTWLGDNLYFQEKWRDAEKAYLEAIGLEQKSFYAWRGLGLTFGQRNKWGDAAKALEKARRIKPDDEDLLLMLGGIYLTELEDLEQALEAFENYIAVGGSDPSIPETIIEIRKQLKKKKKR